MKKINLIKSNIIEITFFVFLAGLIVLVLGLATGMIPLEKSFPSENVFDEMYYDRVYNNGRRLQKCHRFSLGDWWDTDSKKITLILPEGTVEDCYYMTHFGHRKELNSGASMMCFKKEKKMMIHISYIIPKTEETPEQIFEGAYLYDVETKELSYGGNIPVDLEPLLFGVILSEWFQYNSDFSKYSIEDLGEYIDAERTLTAEEWLRYQPYEDEAPEGWLPASP